MQLFIQRVEDDPFFVASWILIMVFSICVHECAHAWVALRQGDDTAAEQGHVSLNPLVQMGWASLLMLALFGIAWGAVPVDVRQMRRPASAAWVAAAGPLANLLLSLGFSGLLVAGTLAPALATPLTVEFLKLAAVANGVLFVFNLLPLPMFDGWAMASVLVPALQRIDAARVQMWSLLALAALWMSPLGGWVWLAGARIAGLGVVLWSGALGFLT